MACESKASREAARDKEQNTLEVENATCNYVALALMAPPTARAPAADPSPAPYRPVVGKNSPRHDNSDGDLVDAPDKDIDARSTVDVAIHRAEAQAGVAAPPNETTTTLAFQANSTHAQFRGQ